MKRLAGMVMMAGVLAAAMAIQTTAQQPRKPDAQTRGEASRGGADANIKQNRDAALKDKEAQPLAPDAKTGEKARQRVCKLVFDNYTKFWIDVYADQRYRGTVAPYGELATYVVAGPTVMYGVSNAAGLTWGPARYNCNTEFWWRLDP